MNEKEESLKELESDLLNLKKFKKCKQKRLVILNSG